LTCFSCKMEIFFRENGFYIFAKMKQTKFSRKFESENFAIFAKISRKFSEFSLNFRFRENLILHFRPNSTQHMQYTVAVKGSVIRPPILLIWRLSWVIRPSHDYSRQQAYHYKYRNRSPPIIYLVIILRTDDQKIII
jgi:hypothetical protein